MLLTSIPSPDVNHITFDLPWIGQISIYFYGVIIMFGMVLAVILTNYRLTKKGAEPWTVIDIGVFWAIPFGIVGARIYHVLSHPNDYFYEGADLWEVVRIWNGGIAIFGSLIGGAIGAWIGCRVYKVRFWSFADAVAPGLLLAQGIGRWGNYFNNELFGTPTNLPWGLEISPENPAYPVGLPDGILFHPTFLYESLWNFLGVIIILLLEKRYRLQWGKIFALYLIWYGIGRAVFESIRLDPSEVFLGIRTNVWGALAAIATGLFILWWQTKRHPGFEKSAYLDGRTAKERQADQLAAEASEHADAATVTEEDSAVKAKASEPASSDLVTEATNSTK